MRVDNTATGLSILAACTTDVKQWYMQNELQLNPDKSEALFMGTATQLRAVLSLTSVSVAPPPPQKTYPTASTRRGC